MLLDFIKTISTPSFTINVSRNIEHVNERLMLGGKDTMGDQHYWRSKCLFSCRVWSSPPRGMDAHLIRRKVIAQWKYSHASIERTYSDIYIVYTYRRNTDYPLESKLPKTALRWLAMKKINDWPQMDTQWIKRKTPSGYLWVSVCFLLWYPTEI